MNLQGPNPLPTEDVTRAMPHALGPEKSILSSMLQDPQKYIGEAIEAGVTPETFYMPAHSKLFGKLVELFSAGLEVELVSLVQRLLDDGMLDSVGGAAEVTGLYTYAPTAGHFRHHLKMVQDKHLLRALISASTEAIAQAYDEPGDAKELLDHAESRLSAIRDGLDTVQQMDTKQAVVSVLDEFERVVEGKQASYGLSTGFEQFDRMSRGLKPGEVFIVGARPSMGKTAIMMNIVETVCLDHFHPSLVFSCEMSRQQLIQRLIFSRSRTAWPQPGERPDRGALQRIRDVSMEVANSALHIDDTPGITINELRAKARRMKRERGIKLIGIDYLQLLRSTSKQAQNSREREISEISAGVKSLAKELGLPIILLAQLNRASESRAGKSRGVPRMSDLRESGSIEQDGDYIGLLHREGYFAEDDEERQAAEGRARLILAKNRNGATGDIPLTFIAEQMRFESGNPADEPRPEPKTATRW